MSLSIIGDIHAIRLYSKEDVYKQTRTSVYNPESGKYTSIGDIPFHGTCAFCGERSVPCTILEIRVHEDGSWRDDTVCMSCLPDLMDLAEDSDRFIEVLSSYL